MEWIKTSDQMPEFAGNYLVFDENDPKKTIYMYFYQHGDTYWEKIWNKRVTHWMPLPPIPITSREE